MNTPERGPAIIDLDTRPAPSYFGQAILGIFAVLIGALLVKSLPWLTPVWLGPPLFAALLADIWSLWVVRRERERLAGMNIYRLALHGRTIHVTDEAAIKGLIGRPALLVPVLGGVAVALLTAGFFVRQNGAGAWNFHFGWLLPVMQCMPFLAAVAGIFAAVLISRAVLAWRLQQAVLRSAHLPYTHYPASATFVISSLLTLYVLSDFGRTAYEALKPKPPVKVLGDLLFSSLSPFRDVLVEHRESAIAGDRPGREIYLVDPADPSKRIRLFRYDRAAKVTFSPDESRLIISEKMGGRVAPVVMVANKGLAGSKANSFVATDKDWESSGMLDGRLRALYFRHGAWTQQPGNIWIEEWSDDGQIVIFAVEPQMDKAAQERKPNFYCAWDCDRNEFIANEGQRLDAKLALALFAEERASKARAVQTSFRTKLVAFVAAKTAAENRHDLEGIANSYATEIDYLDKGMVDREGIKRYREDQFRFWPESKETTVGEIEEPWNKGVTWHAKWKTQVSMSAPERRETLRQELEHECELVEQAGHLRITKQKIKLVKEEKHTEPETKMPSPPANLVTEIPTNPLTNATPPPAKPMRFPEGDWIITKENQDEQAIGNSMSRVIVRGTTFTYDIQFINRLRDPTNNPFRNPALRGVKEWRSTDHYEGRIIRADDSQFTVKITSAKFLNRSVRNFPPDGGLDKYVGNEWIFVNVNGNISDARNRSTVFVKKKP